MSSITSRAPRVVLSAVVLACLACGGGDPVAPPPPPPPPPPPAPVLSAIRADTLVPGDRVILAGENFSSVAAENLVLIGDETATVASASDTLLEVTVPGTACLPPRRATVSVAVDGRPSNGLEATVDPRDPFAPAVGELTIAATGRPCLQLPASTTPETYLIGVQRVSSAASSASTVRVSAVSSGAASNLVQPVRPSRAERAYIPARLDRRWHSTPAPGGLSRGVAFAALPEGRNAVAIDSVVLPGDTVSIRSVTPVSSSCADWTPVEAVVRRVGSRAIWIEDLANAPGSFSDAEIQAMSAEFDDVIYEVDTDWFGEPGDSDGNGRVVVVISRKVNAIDPGLGGFVVGCDLFPRTAVAGSNEGEYLWLGPPDPGGAYGPATTSAATLAFLRRVVAHEFVHVIQFTRRLGPNGIAPMGDFIVEAQPTLAEEVVGNAFLGILPRSNAGFGVAFNSPPVTETAWYASTFSDLSRYFGSTASDTRVADAPHACGWLDSDPSPCPPGRPLFYGVGWSILRWITDHLAPDLGGEQAVQRALIDTPSAGFQLLTDVTGMPMDSLLARWAAALYLDDRYAGLPDRLAFPSWNLLDVFEGPQQPKATAGLAPITLGYGDFDVTASVASGSTAYYVLEGDSREATAVRIASQAGGDLPQAVQAFIVRVE